MALVDTGRSIGAVSRLLRDRLLANMGTAVVDVTVGRPEPPSTNGNINNPRLNIFLYEVYHDEFLRNVPLDEGQSVPQWLVLRYLLTAFDDQGDSDSIEAHELLGEAMRILQDLNFFSLTGLPATVVAALNDNPDLLKLTFEDASSDLLSKLMQGSDERYRCSVAFQVRPVMVSSAQPPLYSLLVGVNYQTDTVIGEEGIQIPVLPSMGPVITGLDPVRFEPGATLTVRGEDLHLAGLSVHLGPVELIPTSQRPDRLTCVVDGDIPDGVITSAGHHVVTVSQLISTGRRRYSNPLVGGLMPVLSTATPTGLTRVTPADPASNVFGNIDLTGVLLGTDQDDVFVALYRNGSTMAMFDSLVPVPPPPPPPPVTPQTQRRLQISQAAAVPPGQYLVILRVNGVQARTSPLVDLTVP